MTAGRALIAPLALEYLTVTMSERGIRVLHADAEHDLHATAQAREVYDVSGAGDTVIATLAAAAAAELDLESAIQLANVAAGIVVSRVGTVPIDRDSLLATLVDGTGAEHAGKGGGPRRSAGARGAVAQSR